MSAEVGGGTLYIGADTSLYRSGVDNLKTDDSLTVAGTLKFGSLADANLCANFSLLLHVCARICTWLTTA
jgi:hypothetical protein